jgi:hypothetical protein
MKWHPDSQAIRDELLKSGIACPVHGCTVIIQRTKDGKLHDGIKTHMRVVHSDPLNPN